MPELPEVETIARGVAQRVRGERVESVWLSGRPQTLKSPPRTIARTLEGAARACGLTRRFGSPVILRLERGGASPPQERPLVS